MDDHDGQSLIYREHGFPCPLVRWHNHKEYELHLIVASSGKVFIGDYVGNFAPDSLFLTGPHLPHNWISQVDEGEVVRKRDMLVNFTDELLQAASGVFSELRQLAPMLERSRYGIEFRCPRTIRRARQLMQQVADSQGMTRLGYFLIMLELLAACDDYQLLSGATAVQLGDDLHVDRTNLAVNYIFAHYMRELPLEEVASHLGMKRPTSRASSSAPPGAATWSSSTACGSASPANCWSTATSRSPTSASSRASTTCRTSTGASSSSRA